MGIVAAEGNMCICPRILSSVEEPWTFWLGGTKGIDSDEIVDPRTLPKGWAYIAKRSITLRTRTVAPNACAASIAVLDIMERECLVERAAKMGAILGDRLHAELDGHPAVVEVRGRGMFYGIELRIPNAPVIAEALSRDMWIYPAGSGPVPSAVMIAPPFVITDDELDQVVSTLRLSLDAVAT